MGAVGGGAESERSLCLLPLWSPSERHGVPGSLYSCPRGGLAPPGCPRTDARAPFSFPGTLRRCGRGGDLSQATQSVTLPLCKPSTEWWLQVTGLFSVLRCVPQTGGAPESWVQASGDTLFFSAGRLGCPLLCWTLNCCVGPQTLGGPPVPAALPNFPLLPKEIRSGGLQETG